MPRSPLARVRSLLSRLTGTVDSTTREARLAEEVQFHIDMHAERNRERGLPPDEATRAHSARWQSLNRSTSVPVAVINETLARRYWPAGDAIGKQVRFGFYGRPIEREIVGIVGDVRQVALDASPDPMVYLPNAQEPTGSLFLMLRTELEPTALMHDVKRLVTEMNPALPVATMATAEDYVADSLKPRRFTLLLFGCFSLGALLLAVVGVYGVVRHSTAERSRELGVRIALGAQSRDIVGMVMRQGLASAGIGVVSGLLVAGALTRLLSSMLFSVSPLDWVTFVSVSALMFGTAIVACYVPARRATRTDPLAALRAG